MPSNFDTDFDDDGDDIIYADHVKQFAQPINDLETGAAWYRDDIGTEDNYKVDFSTDNVIEDYAPGFVVHFKAATANTGAATLTIQGSDGLDPPGAVNLAAIPLVKKGDPLDAGDIQADQVVVAIYTEDTGGANPRFEVIGGIGGSGSSGGADKLDDLDDVAVSVLTLAEGQTLRYNGTEFENAELEIEDVPGLETALDAKQDSSEKGQPDGYAELDSTGKVPVSQLPASVGGTVNVLDDLDDVVITSPATGHVLRHDGTEFVNVALGISHVAGLQGELDDKQDTLTGVSDVPGLTTALGGKQDDLTGVSDVPGLQTALDGKQDESEKGQANGYAGLDSGGKVPSAQLPDAGISDITGLQTALDGKQDESEKGQANGYAGLDATGKVPLAQLPASAGSGVTELDDLDDVVITSPASGQVVKHNGISFVNAAVGVADVSGLQAELDDKQDVLTGAADVPGLDTALAGKANSSHTHSTSDITSGTLAVAQGGTSAANAAGARANLGAQAQDSALDEISGLTMTKGDILVHDGTAVTKLSPGSNGQLLSADSTQTNGLTWVSGSSGGSPTGTANKVSYFNSSGALASTANLSYLDATTRMGVGPTAPTSTVHVSSAASGAVDGSTGLKVSRSGTEVALEAGLSNDSYVGTIHNHSFNLRTYNTPRFSLNSAGQCTLFPEISGGQKLKLTGYSGTPDGSKGLELGTVGGWLVRMEVDAGNDSYVGTVYNHAFHLRTYNTPRFSLNGAGQCTLFPEIVGGQQLRLSGFSGTPNGNKGIELRTTSYYLLRMEVDDGNNSYIGTVYNNAFHLRTNNTPRFSLSGAGQCTLFPEIVGGQKLKLSGYSGTPDGNKGIELGTIGGWLLRMEVDSANNSYVGTVYSHDFHLRTNNSPRFSLNGAGQCTLFPEIVGGQKLKLSGYSGTVNGSKGIEIVNSCTVKMEAGNGNDSYVGTVNNGDFNLRRNNSNVMALTSTAAELNDNYGMRFKEAIANGASYVEVKAPASLAGNVTFTLPATTGTANQYLKTDGSGNTSWATGPGGSGSTNAIAFWSNADTLSYSSGFSRSGSELVAPTLTTGFGQIWSNEPFLTLATRQSGSLHFQLAFSSGKSYLYDVRNLGAGNLMYWNSDGEIVYQYSRGAHKEDVKPVELSMDDLMKWRPVEFKWKEKFGGNQDVGLIAEEVASVYPLATTSDQPWDYVDEKTGEYAVDDTGRPKRLEGDPVVAGVKYEKAWIPMLAAVQDFYKKFQQEQAKTEARLTALEGAR